MDTPIKLMRFADLKAAGIITNWPQLARMVATHGFPAGYLLSPGCRVWDAADIERWLDTRRQAARHPRESAEHHVAA